MTEATSPAGTAKASPARHIAVCASARSLPHSFATLSLSLPCVPLLACSNCERAGKLKGAKNQARLLRQLEGQMATVQQLLQAERERQNPGAAKAARAAGGGSSGGSGGQRSSMDGGDPSRGRGRREASCSSPLPYGMEPCDYSSEDEDESGSSAAPSSRSSRRRSSSGSRRRRAARSNGAAPPAVLYSGEE